MNKGKSKTVAVIPARGGSKRLKDKNLLNLGPHSLLEHSIKYALSNRKYIDEIVVTTDNREIKKIASRYNVKIVDRPAELSSDTSTTVDALIHTLNNVSGSFNNVVLLQPTNPLRPEKMLAECLKLFEEKKCESLFTISRNRDKLGKLLDGSFQPFNYVPGQRSQDIEPLYYENGLLYISRVETIINGQIITEKSYPYLIDHPFGQIDIDVQEDLDFAGFIYRKYFE